MKQVTFIHAADLHLDSPMIGLSYLPKDIFERLKESTFTALKKITDMAIQHNVDFVIFAGDLFDEQDRSIRAQTRLRKEMERLKTHQIPVYLIHGNHDHLNGQWVHLEMPDNVHIFSDKVEIKTNTSAGIRTNLYGFSYEKRHVTDNRLEQYIKKDADFHIGILHGHNEGDSDHGNYASFRIKDLLNKQFDYWALGHIHKREILHQNPSIVYPGNIQGRNRKEQGQKGCYLVQLTSASTKLDFLETSDIIWDTAAIDGNKINSFQELYLLCQKIIEKKRIAGKGILLTLTITNMHLSEKELISIRNGELIQVLQDEEKDHDSFVWPIKIELTQSSINDQEILEKESDFYMELFKEVGRIENITNSAVPLFEHPQAAKFLHSLTEKEKQELQKEAMQILIRLLH